jgi:hypothetical protein
VFDFADLEADFALFACIFVGRLVLSENATRLAFGKTNEAVSPSLVLVLSDPRLAGIVEAVFDGLDLGKGLSATAGAFLDLVSGGISMIVDQKFKMAR